MTTHQDLDTIDERALRSLDGMTLNRDAFARDVLLLTAELRNWRAAHARAETRSQSDSGFAGAFADIFKGFAK